MSQISTSPQIGDLAPDCNLPDGTRLFEKRGQPLILAFAPDEWNPAHAYQSELFEQLSREFSGGNAAFVDASQNDWLSLDASGDLAEEFGVSGRRAICLIDEKSVLRWKLVVDQGDSIHPGEVLAALESLSANTQKPDGISRRAFLSATLAAAALLSVAGTSSAAPSNKREPEAAGRRTQPINYVKDGTIPVTLKVNGRSQKLQIEPRVALLDALREYMGLTGSKKGCDHGQCGACTVHIDGQRALSCLTLAVMNEGKEITTIEGISRGEDLHPVQTAFIKNDAFQCGYCTPGQIMSAVALLKEGRAKSDAEIREAMSGNLCRCAAYPNIIAAIKEAREA
jgi:xanthine dehydrogenase YagT iron-sulfur-binding subunit